MPVKRFNCTFPFMWAFPLSIEATKYGAYIQILCFTIIIGEPF